MAVLSTKYCFRCCEPGLQDRLWGERALVRRMLGVADEWPDVLLKPQE